MRQKLNTMTELADAIGISRPTLSRYFEDPASVRASTRSAIEGGLRRFDYVPNFFARNMNRKKTGLLGVVIPTIRDQFYASLVEAIDNWGAEQDYSVFIHNSHGQEDEELRALESLRSMNADGAIVAPVGGNKGLDAFGRLSRQMPLVFLDSEPPNSAGIFPFVGTDNRQSVRLLVDYLCRSGKPPVFLGMPRVNSSSEERARTYAERLRELGHQPEIIANDSDASTWDFEDHAYRLMHRNFALGRYADATILCANDRLAMGALRAANEFDLFGRHRDMPGFFRIAGHDNHPLSSFLWPSLTTVAQNVDAMARTAVDLIISACDSDGRPEPRRHLLEAHLVLRSSA